MRKLLRLVLAALTLLVPLLGGAAAGAWLRGAPPLAAPADGTPAESGHGEAAAGAAPPADDHGGGGAEAGGEVSSFRFPQQFFVPIVRGGNLEHVMILSLSLEMPARNEEAVFKQEDRLRDASLRALFLHANTGGFDGNFTAAAHLDLLQQELLASARKVAPDVTRVLIGDIGRQDT